MSTYVIGDVHGCFEPLKRLLTEISFDEASDRLIFLGDLINRGPNSLEVLRFVYKHRQAMTTVLGNHELFALALLLNSLEPFEKPHTLHDLLSASDKEELCTWLRTQPLIIKEGDNVFVHAGILPAWSIEEAMAHAKNVQEELKGKKAKEFLTDYYSAHSLALSPSLNSRDVNKLALASFVFMRACSSEIHMEFYDGEIEEMPSGFKPWFRLRDQPEQIFFGHWSALGLYRERNFICLDTGCVWGRELTAFRLEDKKIFQVKA